MFIKSGRNPLTILPGTGDAVTNYTDVGGVANAASRLYRVRLAP
jgi:hypothetical protein